MGSEQQGNSMMTLLIQARATSGQGEVGNGVWCYGLELFERGNTGRGSSDDEAIIRAAPCC